jgi:serine/threonine protein kinase
MNDKENGKEKPIINKNIQISSTKNNLYDPNTFNTTLSSLNLQTSGNTSSKKLNNLKNRMLILSPTVQEGLERECNKDDFEALDDKALGKGGFGHVWKVRHKVTGKIYAIKVINKDYIKKENMVEQINREIEIMYRTDHPHIIKLYNHYEDEENFYLIMHCASKGQLYSLLKRVKRLDERTVSQYMREVISAVKYLHSMKPPIIHRDIKPENILLDSDGRAKLADFGWSNFQDENKQRETYCGTPEYLAPEMVTKSGHDESIDIWSLGVLMFELLAGRPPFVYKGDTNTLYTDIKNLKISWTDDFPILAKNLISKILKLKPAERPSLDEILDHPWFKETPIIKPVLKAYDYDPAAKLRSHLIHFIPEEEEKLNDTIKTMLLQKRESIKKNEDNKESHRSEKEIIYETQLKYHKDEIKFFKEEISKKDKIIDDLKSKIDKISNDETTLRIRDQERISFITELENKTKRLLETESSYNLLKNEFNQLEKQYQTLKENLEEANLKNYQLDKSVNDLNSKINKLDQEKQQEIMNLEMKLRIAENNFVQDSKDANEAGCDPDKIFQMTKEYLNELLDQVKNKFSKIEDKILDQEKTEAEFRSNLSNKIDKKINDMVSNFKDTHERIVTEEKNFFKKQLEDASNKNFTFSKSIEWYKQQVTELHSYKQKYHQDVYLLSKLKDEVSTLTNSRDVLIEKNNYLDDLVKNQYEQLINLKNAREKYKNAFLEADVLFSKFVNKKNLRDLINFKENFPEA